MASTLQPAELLALDVLVTPTAHGIASRVLARTAAGSIAHVAHHAARVGCKGKLSNCTCRLRWETERRDSVNHRAAPPLRVDGQLPAHDPQPFLHAGQAEPRPPHRLERVKAGARIVDGQVDRVDVTVQSDVGVSRLAMLDDVLQGFLQDAVETQGDFRRQRFRDVLEVNVSRDTMPTRQLFAEPSHRRFQPQEFQFRGVKVVRQRLNIGHEIHNLLADFPDLLLETGR